MDECGGLEIHWSAMSGLAGSNPAPSAFVPLFVGVGEVGNNRVGEVVCFLLAL